MLGPSTPLLLSPSLELLLLGTMSYGAEYPSDQLGSAIRAVSLLYLLFTPILLAGGAEWEKESALTLCEHCSATAKTSVCYQHCLVANPKHSTTLAAMEKADCIQARPSMYRRLAASLVIFLSIRQFLLH